MRKGTSTSTSWALDRRAFMKLIAIAGSAACAPTALTGCEPNSTPRLDVKFAAPVRRPLDLLCLDVGLVNLKITSSDELIRNRGGDPAYVVLDLPPQHLMERVIREGNAGDETLSPPLASLLSGPTRLVFSMPDEVDSVPWSLAPLLDAIATWPLNVSDAAQPAAPPAATSPGPRPFRLP